MALIKLNNRAVKDATTFGSISSLGEMKFISKATASASASIEFTSGIDSTYKEYVFYFVNIHPQTDDVDFQFNLSTDNGSNYNVTKTSTYFQAQHNEADTDAALNYNGGYDIAQGTGFQSLSGDDLGADNDQNLGGYLHIFNPASTTYTKHYIATTSFSHRGDYMINVNTAGYGNTTSAIDAVKFQMSSGNIDSGEIILFGIN
jgi:hypothetical protein